MNFLQDNAMPEKVCLNDICKPTLIATLIASRHQAIVRRSIDQS